MSVEYLTVIRTKVEIHRKNIFRWYHIQMVEMKSVNKSSQSFDIESIFHEI